ncbi:DUF3224 domain-containing protein [Actinokineospora sp. G85]|uniref:DUF3224 domain-containing protein n=1 Tax=Actinokineospora sp. G85 TaxID=3406626 RepID=UPI003C751600
MGVDAKATLRMSDWKEELYQDEATAIKLAKADSIATFSGDIEGSGVAQWLLAYPEGVPATFVGFQSVTGKVSGRSGSFVLKMTGTYESDTADVSWSVVPGSGTGELEGLAGEGGYRAPLGTTDLPVTLNYTVER